MSMAFIRIISVWHSSIRGKIFTPSEILVRIKLQLFGEFRGVLCSCRCDLWKSVAPNFPKRNFQRAAAGNLWNNDAYT